MKSQKQQGDVLFLRIKNLPANVEKLCSHNGKFILAEGEAIGHTHCVENIDNVLFEKDGTLYLSVSNKETTVMHEEHRAVTLEKGVWEIGNVVEFDPFEDEIRKVAD